MAILCKDLGLLYIMVPGTGCSVLGNVLLRQFGGSYLPERDIVQNGRIVHQRKHNTVPQILRDGLITQTELESLLVVANVRNPFDRLVTYYQRLAGDWTEYAHGVQRRLIERERQAMGEAEYAERVKLHERRMRRQQQRQRMIHRIGFNPWVLGTIARWCARDAIAPPYLRINRREMLFPMLEGVDVVIRNEQLQEDVAALLETLGTGKVEIPRKNVTQGKRPYTSYYSGFTRGVLSLLYRNQLSEFGYTFDGCSSDSPLISRTPKYSRLQEGEGKAVTMRSEANLQDATC